MPMQGKHGENHSADKVMLNAKQCLFENRDTLHRRAEFTMSLVIVDDVGPLAGPSSTSEKDAPQT